MDSKSSPSAVKPDARGPVFPSLKYVTHQADRPYEGINFFDVPEENYHEGQRTGVHVAAQFLMMTRDSDEDVIVPALRAAMKVFAEAQGSDADAVDRFGAAASFINIIERVLTAACKTIELTPFIANELALHEEMDLQEINALKAKNAELLGLMTSKVVEVSHG